eukprot:CAMPEP_0184975758 /NCGR_PEP_ID=MMETSP1098-20130426/6898_1 /TAXON_ID=89044 /ORGANISM="Spumella elongata, Strain CCAP 955/1" /LENGTH=912 /DNA_ID=CAMNT_0027498531 /DNA_START=40 /DNA_END=2778 /DNA_ORIENTATION=-
MDSTEVLDNCEPVSRGGSFKSNEVLIIGDEAVGDKTSLQNSFKKFRDQKIKEKNLMKANRDAALSGGRTIEYKEALRSKFIDTAKKYLGVPYGIKYKKEDEPVAPLYLDCCGLVRQAVQDLQEEFGFVIGKWNQAYQMDTLPIVLSESELKPGDLIFYEGTYISQRSKTQKHNNVHVEIFLGGETGEATIGSRFHSGKVSIFPSYKFVSSTWKLVNYHFRSLDTWLDGVCKSCCEEHPWHSDVLNYLETAGKRSIFCQETQGDDCSAGGEEEDDDGEEKEKVPAGDVVNTADEKAETVEEATVPVLASSSAEDEGEQRHAPAAESGAGATDIQQHNELASDTVAKDVKPTVESSKSGKKPKRVSAFSANNTNTAAPVPAAAAAAPASSAKMGRASSIRASGETSSSTTSSSKATASAPVTDFKVARSGKEGARSYYLGKTNGWKLVRAAMDRRGWTMMPTDYHFSTKYGFKWVERRNQIDYIAHVPGQLVCHIPNNDIITTKIGILCTLRDKFCRQAPGSAARIHPPWLPHTYDLESPADCIALLAEEERLSSGAAVSRKARPAAAATAVAPPRSPATLKAESAEEDSSAAAQQMPDVPDQAQADDDEDELAGKVGSDITGGIWIYKPSCTNRGRGIRVITGMPALKELCYGKPMGGDAETTIPFKGIVQKYIRNPLLVTSEGYKFDVRCYLLIARNYPTTLAFYHPGYCRLALKPYTIATSASLEDNCVHLTNAAIQKKDAIYKEEGNKELQIQTVAAIADNLEELGKTDSADFLRNELDNQIKLCLVDVMKASNHVLRKGHGYFDLLGCDFMMSASNKLSLLEINTNPSLTLDNSTLANMLPDIVDGAIELVMQSQGPDRRSGDNDDFLKADLPGKFSLIFDEGTGYTFKGARKGKSAKSTSSKPTAPVA